MTHALPSVAKEYRVPYIPLPRANSFSQAGTNKEMKNVCPKLEKNVINIPNERMRRSRLKRST
jgi:hypothetical protein